MENVEAIGVALLSMIGMGVVFVMIYWLSMLLFPVIIMAIVGFLVYLTKVSTKKTESTPYTYKKVQ